MMETDESSDLEEKIQNMEEAWYERMELRM